jgi:hypothetical protein
MDNPLAVCCCSLPQSLVTGGVFASRRRGTPFPVEQYEVRRSRGIAHDSEAERPAEVDELQMAAGLVVDADLVNAEPEAWPETETPAGRTRRRQSGAVETDRSARELASVISK